MFSPKGFGSISSKQQGSSPDYSAKLSHQLKVCRHSVPFTNRQDSDVGRGPANSLGYRTCPVEVKAGFSAPLLAASSKHPTCASGSCKYIHWHLRLPTECCKRQLTKQTRHLIKSTCSQLAQISEDPEQCASMQTRKPSLLLFLALNLTNSHTHLLAPDAGLSLPGF